MENLPTKEFEPTSPSDQELADIFFLSFRFSQGLPSLQAEIFHYFHLTNLHWKITSEREQNIFDRARNKILPTVFAGKKDSEKADSSNNQATKYLRRGPVRHTLYTSSSLKAEQNNDTKDEGRRLLTKTDVSLTASEEFKVFTDIVNVTYLTNQNIRKKLYIDKGLKLYKSKDKTIELIASLMQQRDMYYQNNPEHQRNFNYFEYYAKEGNTTHNPYYDQLFQDMKNIVLTKQTNDN